MGNKLPEQSCNIYKEGSIDSWDEGLPLGNGKCGCLIWGNGRELTFSLDRGDLWDETPAEEVVREDFTFQTLAAYAKDGNTEKIRRLFDSPYHNATPTKLPAGKIKFSFPGIDKLKFSLELRTAQAEVVSQDGTLKMRTYMHAVNKAGFIEILGSDTIDYQLYSPEFGNISDKGEDVREAWTVSQGNLKRLKYSAVIKKAKGNVRWTVQEVKDFSYGIFVGEKQQGGRKLIVYKIASTKDALNWEEAAIRQIEELLETGFEGAAAGHRQWWKEYWEKSSVTIPETLYEKGWYISNYLFGACSRKGELPMPLQGVWTADNGELPPWKGDYHHDLNTQLSYSHYLKANHLKEGESFLDYLWEMLPKGREFAGRFYGSKGACLPAVMSAGGIALGGWAMYSLTPTNQLWLGQIFAKHYFYTGDRAFLEERAYPYLKESFLCIMGLLETGEDGQYRLPVSSSPEIHDDEAQAWLTPNSNYDLALMLYTVSTLKKLARVLNNKEAEFWENEEHKFPSLAVNDRHVLMLSPDEEAFESHRHHSHAMAIHPLCLLDYEKQEDKEIIDATILDLERLGTGNWVGFSFPWMALLYTRQMNGNGAAYQLRMFWDSFCSPNGFNLNGDYKMHGLSTFHYRPFTLEANMSAADALQEMLLRAEDGKIQLFPAIPVEWREEVAFSGLRGERGIIISAACNKGDIKMLQIEASVSGEWEIIWNQAIPLKFDKELTMEKTRRGYRILLEAGRKYTYNV